MSYRGTNTSHRRNNGSWGGVCDDTCKSYLIENDLNNGSINYATTGDNYGKKRYLEFKNRR